MICIKVENIRKYYMLSIGSESIEINVKKD